jgi:hypothetical protein
VIEDLLGVMEIENKVENNLRNKLNAWLNKSDWTEGELIRWLRGLELPAVGYEEDSYIWMMRGLPLADERYQAEKELARRVSLFLSRQPDVTHPDLGGEEVLYNLFMLCAELQCRDELADPLFQVLSRQSLAGEWRGFDLREALVSALIYNQRDNRLESVWAAMFSAKSEFLPGDAYTAFAGILYMPESERKRGEPHLDAIGAALARMAEYLEPQKNGQTEFLRLITWAMEAYPQSGTLWVKNLIEQADKHQWSDWAIVRLDLVCQLERVAKDSSEGHYYYIWQAYLPFLMELNENIKQSSINHRVLQIKSLCSGQIHKVWVSIDTEELLIAITFKAEIERRKASADFSSYDTVYKITCATFQDTASTYLENSRMHREKLDLVVRASQNAGIESLAKVYPQAAPKLKAMAAKQMGINC